MSHAMSSSYSKTSPASAYESRPDLFHRNTDCFGAVFNMRVQRLDAHLCPPTLLCGHGCRLDSRTQSCGENRMLNTEAGLFTHGVIDERLYVALGVALLPCPICGDLTTPFPLNDSFFERIALLVCHREPGYCRRRT